MRLLLVLMLTLLPASASGQPAGETILVFSGTTGFRHDSIPAGIAAISRLAEDRRLIVIASEDPRVFSDERLESVSAVVLLSTTTDRKNPASEWLSGERREAFRRFVERGGGVLAVHAAADSHYHWPWYGRMIGGRFAHHPEGTPKGSVALADRNHPANRGLAAQVDRHDEWYYFDDFDPQSNLLATVDPQSIGESDANPNPAAWTRKVGAGRIFYTAMGHTSASYSDPWFLRHLANGLDWVLAD